MEQQEREMKAKLREAKQIAADVGEEEREVQVKEQHFELENKNVTLENERLQEQLDKYCIERDRFEREALKIKEQAERDQIDSEKIGYFKANKERLLDDLRQLRLDLELEQSSLKEDRIKLNLFKNDLKTRQKTIETLRFDFIKQNVEGSGSKYVDEARDLGFFRIQQRSGSGSGQQFYPIQAPDTWEKRKENVSPNAKMENARYLA